jgi:hypothetical protein
MDVPFFIAYDGSLTATVNALCTKAREDRGERRGIAMFLSPRLYSFVLWFILKRILGTITHLDMS